MLHMQECWSSNHGGVGDTATPVANKVMAGGIVLREMHRGWLLGAAVVPATSKPSTSHCGYCKEQCHSDTRKGGKYEC